ncbi:MAG: hypothetical protein GVY07_02435 [Bacteroidetes bacterium]|jgi:sensor histidine kinase YesM|nr:hypothetical protein [Bacteroidota bacterium]
MPDSTTNSPKKPTLTLKGGLMAFTGWVLYTFVYASLITFAEGIPYMYALNGTIINSTILGLLMITAWAIAVRGLYNVHGAAKFTIHVILGTVVSVAWFELYTLFFESMLPAIELGDDFYQNRFWIILSTFFVYAITFAVIHVLQSARQLSEEEEKLAELRALSNQQELATLKAQLNPHFLFNTLNSINAYVTKDPEQTRHMIAHLSGMLRYSLNSFEQDEVRLSEELDFVRKYLRLEKKRLGDRLEYDIKVGNHVDDLRIPPMIIQSLVENAVKHGIAPTEQGGKVELLIHENKGELGIEIKDTGTGLPSDFKPEKSAGIGTGNTDRILKRRYGNHYGLYFDRRELGGTTVSFSIPIR